MEQSIKTFAQQFSYEPEMRNGEIAKFEKFAVCGMGGSHLAADVLLSHSPHLDMVIHSDYGLPDRRDIHERLIIASSYSGNTEETLSGYEQAARHGYFVVSIASGGELIARAVENKTPYIQIPDTGIQPRMALGYSSRAMAHALGLAQISEELQRVALLLKPEELEQEGRALADRMKGKVPIVYTSARNRAVAYNWKIKLNETGKIPAFYNLFPELNHNEMIGFDIVSVTQPLSRNFYVIILKDANDHDRVQKRMDILEKLYSDRGLPVESRMLEGETLFHKIFTSLTLADWTAFYTAQNYGLEAEQVPLVEDFKKLILS